MITDPSHIPDNRRHHTYTITDVITYMITDVITHT